MLTRRAFWLVCAAIVVVVAFGIMYGVRRASYPSVPILSCPTHIELGDQFFNDQVTARFVVKNLGHKELALSSFSTSCTCAGVVARKHGRWERVDGVTVSPGASEVLAVRIAVQGTAGSSQEIHVSFQTSDPSNPTHDLMFTISRVKGNLYCSPAAIVFGAQPPDTVGKRVLRIFDNGGGNRIVESIRSTAPDRFTIRQVVPPSDSSSHEVGGGFVAEIEVVPTPGYAGNLNGMIEVNVSGERSESKLVPVSGEILTEFVVSPSTVVLPHVAGGQTAWWRGITVAARDDHPFRLELTDIPRGLSVQVEPDGEATSFTVRIECPKQISEVATQESKLRLTARRSGKPATELVVPVLTPR